jgi:hypothetical protein
MYSIYLKVKIRLMYYRLAVNGIKHTWFNTIAFVYYAGNWSRQKECIEYKILKATPLHKIQ